MHNSGNSVLFLSNRFFAPARVLKHLPELRIGGIGRKFNFKDHSAFQLILYYGERIIIGVNVDAYFDAPFIKSWLDHPLFRRQYADGQAANIQNQRKLNLARWALCDALVRMIRILDISCRIKPHLPTPQPDNNSRRFISGNI